jgi:hypothetical protein
VFGLKLKLLLSDEEHEWIDVAFEDLLRLLGSERVLSSRIVVPDDKHFPDAYDGSPEAARRMLDRVAGYMGVSTANIHLELVPDTSSPLREVLPYWKEHSKSAAGYYRRGEEHIVIGLDAKHLKDPLVAVATLAHELAHVILLGGNLIKPDHPHMEPFTDLCAVVCGFGVFNSTAAARFTKYQEDRKAGWSMERIGYMSEPM